MIAATVTSITAGQNLNNNSVATLVYKVINIDSSWLKMLDSSAFETLLRDKHLTPNHPTYLYCSADKAQQLTTALQEQGYSLTNNYQSAA